MKLDILYEDNHIIGVVKPAGVLSQSDGSEPEGEDMLSIIGEYLKEKYQKPGKAFVGLVHRLDRNVGGTMIFAKTSKGASRLSAEMRAGTFQKGYFALAEGRIKTKSAMIRHYLYKDERRNIVVDDKKRGKESILVYDVVGHIGNNTLVFAIPVTGRTHQIRAQMAFSGHPLLDDVKYKGKRVTCGNVTFPALWSGTILVKHPTKDESVLLKSVPYGKNAGATWQAQDEKVCEMCTNYLKGIGNDEFNRLYSIRD